MSIIATWIDGVALRQRVAPSANAVLNAIRDDPETASFCSARELAKRANVDVSSVVRAAQSFGYSGWSELSTEVRRRYLSSLSNQTHFDRSQRSNDAGPLGILKKDIEVMNALASSMDIATVEKVATSIATSQRTIILGTGSYAAPGTLLSHNAQCMGYPVYLSTGPLTGMINDIRLLQPGDCVVSFSIWKTSRDVSLLSQIARHRSVNLIVVADRHSHLANIADELILVPSESAGATASVTCAVAVVQCLLGALSDHAPDRTRMALEDLDQIWEQTNAITKD